MKYLTYLVLNKKLSNNQNPGQPTHMNSYTITITLKASKQYTPLQPLLNGAHLPKGRKYAYHDV